MAYQMGVAGCLGFRNMWKAIRERDWVKAHAEALDSEWARNKEGRGTPERARRVAALFLQEASAEKNA